MGLTSCTLVVSAFLAIPDSFIGILPPFPPPTSLWRYPPAKVGLISAPAPAVPVPTTDNVKEARVEGSGANIRGVATAVLKRLAMLAASAP